VGIRAAAGRVGRSATACRGQRPVRPMGNQSSQASPSATAARLDRRVTWIEGVDPSPPLDQARRLWPAGWAAQPRRAADSGQSDRWVKQRSQSSCQPMRPSRPEGHLGRSGRSLATARPDPAAAADGCAGAQEAAATSSGHWPGGCTRGFPGTRSRSGSRGRAFAGIRLNFAQAPRRASSSARAGGPGTSPGDRARRRWLRPSRARWTGACRSASPAARRSPA
jgi:hypothetical protein